MSGNRAAILAATAALALAIPASGAQASRRGTGHPGAGLRSGGGSHPGWGRGGSHAVPRGAVPGRPAYGGVAAARHPRPGGYSHRGYYPRHHHGGYYRPYYYPYYGYPYASFSFGWGWPYSYWGWPYGYGPSYSVAYHAYPGRGWDTPAREADRSDTDAAYAEPRPLDPSRAEGRIRLEVRPEDASVYVDDEFRGAGRETKFLNLAAGRHTIELVRPGFDVVRRDVDVTRGETTDVLVEMTRR